MSTIPVNIQAKERRVVLLHPGGLNQILGLWVQQTVPATFDVQDENGNAIICRLHDVSDSYVRFAIDEMLTPKSA